MAGLVRTVERFTGVGEDWEGEGELMSGGYVRCDGRKMEY